MSVWLLLRSAAGTARIAAPAARAPFTLALLPTTRERSARVDGILPKGFPTTAIPWTRIAANTVVCILLIIQPHSAMAETCLDRLLPLAALHGVPTDPPTVAPGDDSKVTSRDLARSHGVIEPPPVSDEKAVLAPPSGAKYRIPTLPDVNQHPPDASRMTLQAILVAARAEAERGNEAGCWAGLEKAAKFLKSVE